MPSRIAGILIIATCIVVSGCCDKSEARAASQKLYSSDSGVRNDAALTLARCGSLAESSVPRLAQMLYDENIGVQSSAAYALRRIDSASARQALERAIAKKR